MDLVVVAKVIGALALLGVAGGGFVAAASRRMQVEPDHRVEAVLAELPGANCGGCGMPSCFASAVAMTEDRLPIDACVFGGRRVAESVGRVLDDGERRAPARATQAIRAMRRVRV